ncbi:protein-export chaperone SecB [Azonexus caeni]|jgi:preprotein translocase subunit SecB|uniref:protein-export chaperone SecB n=1 Tax=Azonexus TaxID=146936 RepID=UPI0035AFD8BD
MEQGNLQPQFGIERIYLKDISFQVANAPEVYSDSRRYDVGLNINSASRQVSAEVFEVVLTVVATAKQGETEVFKGVVSEGGSFVIRNVKLDQRDAILGVACPNILLPYAREMLADLSTRAGFSPVMIQPVDFEAVFLQQREQARQQAGQGAPLQ